MKNIKKLTISSMLFIFVCVLITSVGFSKEAEQPTIEIVLTSEVKWTYLNPARKELAPMAGTLWGDRNGNEPTGYLLKPPADFQSPPHIHNVSYRGVVIGGQFHNDDAGAETMWMPEGSFWTQPKGQVHITSSQGEQPIAYIEIEKGPYLVLPTKEAFFSQLRPVNVDKTNLVWLNASDVSRLTGPLESGREDEPQISFLWGDTKDGQLNGTFIKFPSNFDGSINNYGSDFRAVVVKGSPQYTITSTDIRTLEAGSYFSSTGAPAVHSISSKTNRETIIYIRTNGKYTVATN